MERIIKHPKFQENLEHVAQEINRPFEEIEKEAKKYLKELYTERKDFSSLFTVQGSQYLLSWAYEHKIDVVPEEIKGIMKLIRRHPVAFLMTHKTYIDTLVLIVTLARYGMPIPYMFGGINMAFTGLKQLGKQVGMIYIRRNIKDNPVYKATLKHFVSSLIAEGNHFTWMIEGTRSRTGKILWPKMGILKYFMEGEQDSGREIKYIPVSVVYDLIPDVKEMTLEGQGKEKKPESLAWFFNYIRKLGDNFGRVAIRFGESVDVKAHQSAIIPDREEDSYEDKYALPRFAFELVYRASQINPVTTVSLVCNALLSNFALAKREIEGHVYELMHFIEKRKKDVLLDRGKPIGESVQTALNLLLQAGIVQKNQSGLQARYLINESEYLPANYYANMAAGHLYHRAFIELALVKVANDQSQDRLLHFWKEIMVLRDLFKFEFFYSNKAEFSDEVEEELNEFDPKWRDLLSDPQGNIPALLERQRASIAEALLLTYLEGYRVVMNTLLNWDSKRDFSEEAFMEVCVFIGKEMHWQGQIRRLESLSKPFLINGLRFAKNRQLIPKDTNPSFPYEKIKASLAQLNEVSNRLEYLQEWVIAKNKRQSIEIPLERNVVPGSNAELHSSEILHEERGKHIGAFFDLDRTLINDFSAKQFLQTRVMSGKMTVQEALTQFGGLMIYASGMQDFASLAALSARGVQGIPEETFVELGEEVYLRHLAAAIYPESRALVATHLAKGHTVAIVSAATLYQVNPIARDLGIEHVMCSLMEVKNGKFTGKMLEPVAWGEGKATLALEFAQKHNLDLSKSYFYTDSMEDLPLMEIVGHPRAVNPDHRLAQWAFEHNWPIYRFKASSGNTLTNTLRTSLAVGSLYPSIVRGITTGALSMSWQKGVNATIASVGDLGSWMAGLDIIIKGKENLESHRPAVFLFNHQSSADLFIVAKLLRHDFKSIAKKELQSNPLGPILKSLGVIFVDRQNKEKAIEAMQPAVDALKSGTSIAIAPEGTRSEDRTLGKFKKGAFHLALQSQVPIVPIIIKNAHDAMPKGSSLLRPANIEVVIAEPIDVSHWKAEQLEQHIEEVRNVYVEELEKMKY